MLQEKIFLFPTSLKGVGINKACGRVQLLQVRVRAKGAPGHRMEGNCGVSGLLPARGAGALALAARVCRGGSSEEEVEVPQVLEQRSPCTPWRAQAGVGLSWWTTARGKDPRWSRGKAV